MKFTDTSDMIEIRHIKYLNNVIEQDHRLINRITKPITSTTKKICVLDEADGMDLRYIAIYLKRKLTALIKLYAMQKALHNSL